MKLTKFRILMQEPELPADEGGGEWNPTYEEEQEQRMLYYMSGETWTAYHSMTEVQRTLYTNMCTKDRAEFIQWSDEERAQYAQMHEHMEDFFNMTSIGRREVMAGKRSRLVSKSVGTDDLEMEIARNAVKDESRRNASSPRGSFNTGPAAQPLDQSSSPNKSHQISNERRLKSPRSPQGRGRCRSPSPVNRKISNSRRVGSPEYDSPHYRERYRSPSPFHSRKNDDHGQRKERNNASSGYNDSYRSPNRSSYNNREYGHRDRDDSSDHDRNRKNGSSDANECGGHYRDDRDSYAKHYGETSRSCYRHDQQDSYGNQNRRNNYDDSSRHRGERSPEQRSRRDSAQNNYDDRSNCHGEKTPRQRNRHCSEERYDSRQNETNYDNKGYQLDRSGSRSERSHFVNTEQPSPSSRSGNTNFLTMPEVLDMIENVKTGVVETATSRIKEAIDSKFEGTSLDDASISRNLTSTSVISPTPITGGFRPFPVGDRSWPPACLTGERLKDHEQGIDRSNDCLFCGGYHYMKDCTVYPTAQQRRDLFAEQGRCYRCRANHLPETCECVNQMRLSLCDHERCRSKEQHDRVFCENSGWRISAKTWDKQVGICGDNNRKWRGEFATKDEVAAVIDALTAEIADAITVQVMKDIEDAGLKTADHFNLGGSKHEDDPTYDSSSHTGGTSPRNTDDQPCSSKSTCSIPRSQPHTESAAQYMLFPVGNRRWPPVNLIGLRKDDHVKGLNRNNDCLCCGGYHQFHKCPVYGKKERRSMFLDQGRCLRCLAFHPQEPCWKHTKLHLCGLPSHEEHHHGFCPDRRDMALD